MAPSEARRDRWGRYLVVPPTGGKPLGYTRATTVAKTLDDQGGLMPWKAAMALTGMTRRSGLRAQIEALVSKHPEKGPWYGSDESKRAIKKLVEECAEAGGSSDRADIGTALHAIIEQIGRGEPVQISQDSTRADVAAYRDLIVKGQIEFLREYIEATFVLDHYQVAGTADGGAVRIPWLSDKLLIADLKTGANLEYSGQAIGVQLATYAHGDAHYVQGLNPDGSQDERRPMPDLDQELAVVIHLPAGEAKAMLYKVDIAAGWEAFQQSMWARDWRKRKDLLEPVDLDQIALHERVATDEPISAMDATRLTLLELIGALPADRQLALKEVWPKRLPPLKNAQHWTPALLVECTQFVAAVASGSAAGTVSSPGSDPAGPDAALHSSVDEGSAEPGSSPGDDTPHLTVEQFDALTAEDQARAIDRGHLPIELRAAVSDLGVLADRVRALDGPIEDGPRRRWVETQARLAELPHLGHPERWTVERAEHLAMLLDTAEQLTDEQLAPPDWAALCKAAGITKAAAGREAKRLAGELGIKVPAKVDDLPTDGVFAVQFSNWIELTSATKASAA